MKSKRSKLAQNLSNLHSAQSSVRMLTLIQLRERFRQSETRKCSHQDTDLCSKTSDAGNRGDFQKYLRISIECEAISVTCQADVRKDSRENSYSAQDKSSI